MKRIFLTGASSGIGLATARLLVARRNEVWATSRNPERIPEMRRLHPTRLDLGDPRSVEQAFNAAKAAMASFTMSIQLELPDSRVRLVDLLPGDICTDFNDAVTKSDQRGPRYEARLAKTWNTVERNMKKAPKPDLIARRVCELIDQANPPPRMTVGD